MKIVAIDRNDVITAIGRRVPDGLVFAHQDDGDSGGEPAKGTGIFPHVDVVPYSRVGETGLKRSASISVLLMHIRSRSRMPYLAKGLRHDVRSRKRQAVTRKER